MSFNSSQRIFRMKVQITDRDLNIFEHIYENGYMSASQIKGACFQNASLLATYQRLFRLGKSGYLKKIRCGNVLFKLNRLALSELSLNQDEIKQYLRKKVVMDQLEHDLSLIDCREKLITTGSIQNWIPAHRLRTKNFNEFQKRDRRKVIVPDAIFELKAGNKLIKVAFEFEKTRKSKSRYVTTFERYHLSMPVDLVLYVTASDELKSLILDITKQTLQKLHRQNIAVKNKLYAATLDDVLHHGTKARFESITGNYFTIHDSNNPLKKEVLTPKVV